MLYALICEDRDGAGPLRAETRPAHLDYLNGLGASLKFAGPFVGPDDKPNGSLVVIEAPDEAGARAIADADPYAEAGLFRSVAVRPWKWVVNNPEV